MVLGVAEGVHAVHEAEHLGHPPSEEPQRLVQRVRAGVQQAAAVDLLERLPVPAAAEAVEGDLDLDDPPQHAGVDDLADLLEVRGETRLLEDGEQALRRRGERDQRVDVHARRASGFSQSTLCPAFRISVVTGRGGGWRGVDDEVQVPALKELAVVRVLSAQRLLGPRGCGPSRSATATIL